MARRMRGWSQLRESLRALNVKNRVQRAAAMRSDKGIVKLAGKMFLKSVEAKKIKR
jgi:hypothetical protein